MNPQITFFNTLTNQQETLKPLNPNHLKMYVCGPTVYDRPHLGNARSVVIYDLIFRFFRQVFSQVTYVRNITDVDDKINAAAKEQGISIQNLTQKITEFFHADTDALNVLRPTFEPRATENIAEMIAMIEQLIANGNAYENAGHVLFDVSSYENYGQLSNRNLDEMIAGARVEVALYKKNPLDFVLWKPADEQDDASSVFASPWGNGRPGWHIECSAMSSKYLGADFDVHGGGADLQFPHHENEIAQSCCANQGSSYAGMWIHNGFLTVNGEKMSKSLKNFITVRDLLDKGISGTTIRYLLLSTHYRKPFDFNQKALDDAQKSVEKFNALLIPFEKGEGAAKAAEGDLREANSDHKSLQENHPSAATAAPSLFFKEGCSPLLSQVLQHLADDLNIAKVIAVLHETAKEIKNSNSPELKAELAQTLDFLGLIETAKSKKTSTQNQIDETYINQQIALRLEAKQQKNYAKADEIRKNLLAQKIALEDVAPDKTLWRQLEN